MSMLQNLWDFTAVSVDVPSCERLQLHADADSTMHSAPYKAQSTEVLPLTKHRTMYKLHTAC